MMKILKRLLRVEVDNPQPLKCAKTTNAYEKMPLPLTVSTPLPLVITLALGAPSAGSILEQVHVNPIVPEVNRTIIISLEDTSTSVADRLAKERRVALKKRKRVEPCEEKRVELPKEEGAKPHDEEEGAEPCEE